MQTRAFQNKWANYCWPVNESPQEMRTSPPGSLGTIGAINKTKIPFEMI